MLDETMSATLTASEGEAEGEADDDDNTTYHARNSCSTLY